MKKIVTCNAEPRPSYVISNPPANELPFTDTKGNAFLFIPFGYIKKMIQINGVKRCPSRIGNSVLHSHERKIARNTNDIILVHAVLR